jgi:hypothetical protein
MSLSLLAEVGSIFSYPAVTEVSDGGWFHCPQNLRIIYLTDEETLDDQEDDGRTVFET